jgi:hypothetical protein
MSETVSTVSIIDVISQYFAIKHHGALLSTKEHDSLIIFPATNSFCWFSEGIAGNYITFLSEIVGLSQEDIISEWGEYTADPFADYISDKELEIHPLDYLGEPATDNSYLINKRLLTNDTIAYYGLEQTYRKIHIPIHNKAGKRIGSQIRYENRVPKYKTIVSELKPPIWPMRALRDAHRYKYCFVFEGAFSVMRWHQVINSTPYLLLPLATMGVLRNRRHLLSILSLLGRKDILFVLDNDEKGKNAIALLDQSNIKYIVPSQYPDEMTDDEILEVFTRTTKGIK